MVKDMLNNFFEMISEPKIKGNVGEWLTEFELHIVKLFGREGKMLHNVYIPKPNGETTEIDVLYITPKGIFVFESKNYSGWIFGKEQDKYWTVTYAKGKNTLYNPIKQNNAHITWLKTYLRSDIKMFSIIAFSERCELKKIEVKSEDIYVIKRTQTYATIRDIWNTYPNVLYPNEIEDLYERLLPLTNVSDSVKREHIRNIKNF